MSSYETSAATGPRALTIETSYLTLAALAWGDPGNRPVLALHGWLDNAASFEPMAPHLPGCRLFCLDLAGHGESGHRSAGIHYHFLDHVQDVIAAVDALGWDRFHILGHSLGASIALYVAAVISERVSGLALIDGYGPLTAEPEAGPDQAAESIAQMLAQPGRKRHVYPDLEAAALARARFGDLRLEDAGRLVARNLEPTDGGYVWRSDAKLRTRSPFYFSERQVHAWLRRVHCPVRLLLARDGFLVKRPQMAARYECTPQLELREIDGAHHVHMERPAATATALADCLPLALEATS